MSGSVTVSAPAKINLCLGVGSVREDGYHPLATVFQSIGLFDEVRVRPAAKDTLTVYGDGVDVSDVITAITGAATPIASIGGAVLVVLVGIKVYKWVRRAM